MMMIPRVVLSLFLLLAPAAFASDQLTCFEQYNYNPSNCNCDYYKKTDCKKPTYEYGNGEGSSYKNKNDNIVWDKVCAACCCLPPSRCFQLFD